MNDQAAREQRRMMRVAGVVSAVAFAATSADDEQLEELERLVARFATRERAPLPPAPEPDREASAPEATPTLGRRKDFLLTLAEVERQTGISANALRIRRHRGSKIPFPICKVEGLGLAVREIDVREYVDKLARAKVDV